jgi:dimeric dUTPase (all-alpha-NTP-PPase superfamily)
MKKHLKSVIHSSDDWFSLLECVSKGYSYSLYYLIFLTEKLGFTFDEIYDAYIEKNKVNYERMKEGY